MKTTIYKYQLPCIIGHTHHMTLPVNSKFLHFDAQGLNPCIWVEVDADEKLKLPTAFKLIATGDEVPHQAEYKGTALFNGGILVLHLYQLY